MFFEKYGNQKHICPYGVIYTIYEITFDFGEACITENRICNFYPKVSKHPRKDKNANKTFLLIVNCICI